ncbi:MAG: glycoside hydrolase family 127 protein [Bacteroidaceae bacterium]
MKKLAVLFLVLLVVSTPAKTQQPTLRKQPLTLVSADSIHLNDFFWMLLNDKVKKDHPLPSPLPYKTPKSTVKTFETDLKRWNKRADSLSLVGGIGSLAKNSPMQTRSALYTFKEALRLHLLTGNGKFINVMERALYNGVCTGFFAKETELRTEVEQISNGIAGYMYATQGENLYANLYIQSEAHIQTKQIDVRINQENNMPWFSSTFLKLTLSKPQHIKLHLHIPEWITDSTLANHSCTGKQAKKSLLLNGKPITAIEENGYWVIDRIWNDSDNVSLRATMPIQRVRTNQHRGVALQRGPFVYGLQTVGEERKFDHATPLDVNYDKDVEHAEIISGNLLNAEGTPSRFYAVPYFLAWKKGESPSVWLKEE